MAIWLSVMKAQGRKSVHEKPSSPHRLPSFLCYDSSALESIMLVYCPTCETACSEQAGVCVKCGHPLAASQFSRVRKGMKRRPVVLIVIVLVVSTLFFASSYRRRPHFPTIAELEQTFGLWKEPSETRLLRGRQLKAIPMTRTALPSFISPPITIYTDQNDRPVGVILTIEDYPVTPEADLLQLNRLIKNNKDLNRHRDRLNLIREFRNSFFPDMLLSPQQIDAQIKEGKLEGGFLDAPSRYVTDSPDAAGMHAWFSHGPYRVECIALPYLCTEANPYSCVANCSWIIRTDNW